MSRRRTVISLISFAALAGCAVPALASTKARTTYAATTAASTSGTAGLGAYRLVSYEPTTQVSGPQTFAEDLWGTYNDAQVQSDLSLLSGMGANAVRIFVSTGDTGTYPSISPTFSSNLGDFVHTAQADGLKVVLSIFNQYPYIPAVSGGWSDTASAAKWMSSLVAPYKNNPEIAYLEMRNEVPAPGYDSPTPSGSGTQAAAWLNALMPQLRVDAGSDPIVLSQNHGVAGYEALDSALSAAAKPDAYSYHFYDYPGFLGGQLALLEQNLSKPVFVGETGYSTALSNTVGGGAGLAQDQNVRNAYQAWYLQAVSFVTNTMGLGNPGMWQLWDTPNASSAYETDFGLYDNSSGTTVAKPAAAALSAVFAAAATSSAILAPSINGTFDTSSSGSGAIPSPWSAQYIGGQVSSSSAQGGNSLCITRAGNDSYFYETLPLASASGLHTLTAWTTGGNWFTSIAIRWLNSAGTPVGFDVRTYQNAPVSGWKELAAAGTAPPGASTAMIILQGNSAGCFSNVAFS